MESSIFSRNMKALQRFHPELFDMLKGIKTENRRFQLQATHRPDIYNLMDLNTGRLYYNTQDVLADVRQQLQKLKLKNTKIAIFLGLGLGYEVVHYWNEMRTEQRTEHILVVEKEIEIFRSALQVLDLSRIIETGVLTFFVGESEINLFKLFNNYFLGQEIRMLFVKAINPVYHPAALILNKEYYLNVLRALRDAATQAVEFYGNDPYDSLLGIENMLANLKEIIKNPGIKLLEGKFKGKPAIVAASGPSLNQCKQLLKGLEDKAVIVCADSTLRILIDAGVKPHLVASLERVPPTVKVMEGYQADEVEEVYYAACPVVPPGAYEVYPGPRLVVFRSYKQFEWLGIEKGTYKIMYSAGNMAYKLAEILGCDPIILVGQDLCFSRDGYTHANGSIMGDKQEVYYSRQPMAVMGNDGQQVITEWAWYACIKGYETDLAHNKGTVINCAAEGACLPGARYMSLEDAIRCYIDQPFYPREQIKEELSKFQADDQKIDLMRVNSLLNETICDMQEAINYCKKGMELVEKHQHKLQNFMRTGEDYTNMVKMLPRLRDEINVLKEAFFAMKNVQGIFAHVAQSFIISHNIELFAIPGKYDDDNRGQADILLRQAEWFAVNGDLASICLKSLVAARENIQLEFNSTSAS